MISPDTQQNIIYTIYFILLHNFPPLVYSACILLAIGAGLYKPTRPAILYIVGFSLLLIGFEYQKHIVDPLIEQTKGSLITERQSYRIAWIVEKILGKGLPVLFNLGGWILVIGTSISVFRNLKHTKKHSH